jgi:hypothetical protein
MTTHTYRMVFNNFSHLELFVTYPIDRTIGELKDFIKTKLRTRSIEGDIYFLFNPYQRDLNDECVLGGILFPDFLVISESILEDNSVFCIRLMDNNISYGQVIRTIQSNGANNSAATTSHVTQEAEEAEGAQEDEAEAAEEAEEEEAEVMDTNSDIANYTIYNYYESILNTPNNSILNHNLLSQYDVIYGGITRNVNIRTIGVPNDLLNFATLVNLYAGQGNLSNAFEDIKVGLNKDDLELLRVDYFKNFNADDSSACKEKYDNCSICIEKLQDEDIVRELKCHHLFHKDCIDHWLDDNIKCPLCRKETGRGVPKL